MAPRQYIKKAEHSYAPVLRSSLLRRTCSDTNGTERSEHGGEPVSVRSDGPKSKNENLISMTNIKKTNPI